MHHLQGLRGTYASGNSSGHLGYIDHVDASSILQSAMVIVKTDTVLACHAGEEDSSQRSDATTPSEGEVDFEKLNFGRESALTRQRELE